MASIGIQCQCGKQYQVAAALAGRHVKCRKCGRAIHVEGHAPVSPARSAPAVPQPLDLAVLGEASLLAGAPVPFGSTLVKTVSAARRSPRGWAFFFWIASIGACVVLVVLIAGALQVRKAIVRMQDQWEEEEALALGESGTVTDDPQERPIGQEAAHLRPTDPPAAADATPGSNETGLEVLPPAAARKPGRTLPKLLLVGEGAGMFRSFEDAIRYAIPGDVVEIRSNRPLLAAGAEIRAMELARERPLTIRAGKGWQPVLRVGMSERPLLTAVNVNLRIESVHFAAGLKLDDNRGFVFIRSTNGDCILDRCSFTLAPKNSATSLEASHVGAHPGTMQVVLSNCLLRGVNAGVYVGGPRIHLKLQNTIIATSSHGSVLLGGLEDDQSVEIVDTILFAGGLRLLSAKDRPVRRPSVRMSRSMFCTRWRSPMLVFLEVITDGGPPDYETSEAALHRAFSRFDGSDSLGAYWDAWAISGDHDIKDFGPYQGPPNTEMTYTPVCDKITELAHQYQPEAYDYLTSVLPQDMVVTPKQGGPIGADPSSIPVPQVGTLILYDRTLLSTVEAETCVVRAKSDGVDIGSRPLPPPLWQPSENEFFAVPTGPGTWVELTIPVPAAGRYALRANFSRGKDSGRIRCDVGGMSALADLDLFANEASAMPAIKLGEFDAPAGGLVLRITSLDPLGTSMGGRQWSVDFFTLRRLN
jgi:hypothetical protein